jgi:hypothetical protein
MPQLIERRSLWHDHPTFVWQGTVDSVAVSAFAAPETPVWTASTLGSAHTVVYSGKALQPGKRYIWTATAAGEQAQVIFELLEQPLRDRITTQLAQLETRLQQQKASPDERVRQRVVFFLDQGLFLDAVQELYSVPHPSQAVQALQNKLVQAVCGDRVAQNYNDEAQRCDRVAQNYNDEAQRCDRVAQNYNDEAQRCDRVAQNYNDEAQRCDRVAQNYNDEAQRCDDETQRRDRVA